MNVREHALVCGDLELDLEGLVVWVDGHRVPLTLDQFEVLRLLLLRDGEPVSRDEMRSPRSLSLRSVDTAVSRLRSLIARSRQVTIETVPLVGYRCIRRMGHLCLAWVVVLAATASDVGELAALPL